MMLESVFVPIAICCVLPIAAIYLGVRQKMNETNKRTQIILAAIEKNSETDIEELLKKMAPKEKLLKEKLLGKLLSGCIFTFSGILIIGFYFYIELTGKAGVKDEVMLLLGIIFIPIGIAFLANYFIGKKLLAKEIEAEEQRLIKH
ncbi:MAG: hypothetical protein J6W52_10700 [Bacteroidaceae bacterium]|nr:hypothetical protein [Bacteroidaceae bacterium]